MCVYNYNYALHALLPLSPITILTLQRKQYIFASFHVVKSVIAPNGKILVIGVLVRYQYCVKLMRAKFVLCILSQTCTQAAKMQLRWVYSVLGPYKLGIRYLCAKIWLSSISLVCFQLILVIKNTTPFLSPTLVSGLRH